MGIFGSDFAGIGHDDCAPAVAMATMVSPERLLMPTWDDLGSSANGVPLWGCRIRQASRQDRSRRSRTQAAHGAPASWHCLASGVRACAGMLIDAVARQSALAQAWARVVVAFELVHSGHYRTLALTRMLRADPLWFCSRS